ncbi:MAG: DNA gyrase inhibitor YacG [Acidobacteria bacterium]|nr:DNA gyrase inhibitor YacG [Acidobacteriota bacterium]
MLVKCPNCGTAAEYEDNEFRPFCSERCRLIDFGAWVNEEYSLPAESSELTEEDLREIEKQAAAEEQNRQAE